MIGKMLKRAVAEALGGRRHGYGGKPWKKGRFRDDRYGGYGSGPGGYGQGPRRGRGVKGALIDALMGFLARRR